MLCGPSELLFLRMLGVILCGGNSSRMGDDKGLLLSNKKTWAQWAHEKLALLTLPTVLSIKSKQEPLYKLIFSEEHLVIDDHLSLAGPLLGVLSVHKRFASEDLMILACDLPLINQKVLETLWYEYKNNRDYEVYVFKFENQTEPLCGIYTHKGLAKILSAYSSKNLERYSMMYVLEQLQTKYIAAPETWKPYFKNFNSPTDL